MAGGRAGREPCAGAGLTSARTAVRRGGMALRTALALAVGADGVGAVVVDGHLGGLGSAFFGWLADKTSIEFIFRISTLLPLLGIITGFLPNIEGRTTNT